MATRFPFAALAVLAVPLLVIGSPVPRTPAKHDLRAVRSIDGAVVVVTDRDESVPEFFARAKRDGAGVFAVHSAGRAADNRRAAPARVQFLNRQLQNNDEQAENLLRNWPDAGVEFLNERVNAILLREIDVEKGSAENPVLLAGATADNKYEVIGYARNADALKTVNEDYRPRPIEHRWQIDRWQLQLRVNDVQQLRVQQVRGE